MKEPKKPEGVIERASLEYYWEHAQIHAASKEHAWVRDLVQACFSDGARWAVKKLTAIELKPCPEGDAC